MEPALQTLFEVSNHIARKHPDVTTYMIEANHKGISEWAKRDFTVPCPKFIKDSVLKRNSLPNSTWIETGTYFGETTELLSTFAKKVYTIEPEPKLYDKAVEKFMSNPTVSVINDISENALPKLLPNIEGNVCFWLDGHYSAGVTFAGPNDTPLIHELNEISRHLSRLLKVVIAIDDIRLCGKVHAYGEYPSLDYLVNWSRDNKMKWNIEYDIFIIKN